MKVQSPSIKSSELTEPLIVSSGGIHAGNANDYRSLLSEGARSDSYKKNFKSISYSLDFEDMIRFKTNIKRNICLFSFLLLSLIIQRPFVSNFTAFENSYIVFLQEYFPIYSAGNFFNLLIYTLNTFPNLILSHIFVTIYYLSKNPLTAVKVMMVEFNFLMIISILEMMAGDPRPFWADSAIQAGACETSYPYPSAHVYAYYFVLYYGTYVYFPPNEYRRPRDRILSLAAYIGVGLILYLEVFAGLMYNFQLLFSIFNTILYAYIAMYFDKSLTRLVEKSTIEVQAAKRSTVFWLIFILVEWVIATTIYATSSPYQNIIWYENLYACFNQHGLQWLLNDVSFTYLLGAWKSYIKNVSGFIWLGAIFGVAKTFRDFEGKIWYQRSFEKKVRMAIFANLCIVPFWFLDIITNQYFQTVTIYSAGIYLFAIVQAVVLNFFLYGVLPYRVFKRFGWTTLVLERLDSLN